MQNTLSPAECATLIGALRALKHELLGAAEEAPPRGPGARGPGRGGAFIRPGRRDAPLHFLAHLVEADPAITAYASHPRLVSRARSHCRFVPPLIRFIPCLLMCSAPLFLKRPCDRTLPRLVAACEEYIGGEARIVESNGFINSGNSKGFARNTL